MHRFRFILNYAKKYIALFIIAEICIIGTYSVALMLPLNTQELIDNVLKGKDYFLFYSILKRYIILFFATIAFNLVYAYTWQTLNNKYVVDVKKSLFEKIVKSKAGFLSGMNIGDLMNRIDSDADQFIHVIQRNIFHFMNSIILCVGITIVLIRINTMIAVLVIIAALLPILATRLATKLTEKYSREARSIFGNYLGRLFEMLNGLRDILLLSATEWSRKSISEPLKKLLKLGNKIRYTDFYVNKTVYFLNLLASLVIYWLSIKLVSTNSISIGMFFAAIEYIALLHKKFNWMLRIYLDWFNRKVCIDRVAEIINVIEEKDEGICAEKIVNIEFNNVTFSYGNDIVLKNVTFNVNKGEHVAFVGVSGVGKTTISNLVMKFYEPQMGDILVNGVSVKSIRNSSLRKEIGWVNQDVVLLDNTLRYNLTLDKEHIKDEHIISMLNASWLGFLPKDLDTKVGEGGLVLSGGQKQLLAVARALLKKPSLIIFDEVTASLDVNTEKEILDFIRKYYKETTMIFISHRLSTVKACDKIIVIKNGMVDGVGSHEQLISQNSEYIQMFGRINA